MTMTDLEELILEFAGDNEFSDGIGGKRVLMYHKDGKHIMYSIDSNKGNLSVWVDQSVKEIPYTLLTDSQVHTEIYSHFVNNNFI